MCALSSADRVPGYEPVGQRFESSRARHKKGTDCNAARSFFIVCTVYSNLLKFRKEFDSFCVAVKKRQKQIIPQNAVQNPLELD